MSLNLTLDIIDSAGEYVGGSIDGKLPFLYQTRTDFTIDVLYLETFDEMWDAYWDWVATFLNDWTDTDTGEVLSTVDEQIAEMKDEMAQAMARWRDEGHTIKFGMI